MLGALGVTGITAWFGIEEIGEPQEGETMVVSAAAGAVGSVAGQLAKLRGARVVGIAGGRRKVRLAGRRARLRRGGGSPRPALARAAARGLPDGVDVDFENVGGEIMRGGLRDAEPERARSALRPDLRVQRRRRSPGPACAGC